MVEYAVMAGLVSGVTIAAMVMMGNDLDQTYSSTSDAIASSSPVTEPDCDLAALAIGASCPGGDFVHAGLDPAGTARIYVMKADAGQFPFNSGSASLLNSPGALSDTDGVANTTELVAVTSLPGPNQAAEACRARGPEWFLPARDMLSGILREDDARGLGGSFGAGGHWSSTQSTPGRAHVVFGNDALPDDTSGQEAPLLVRCVRYD